MNVLSALIEQYYYINGGILCSFLGVSVTEVERERHDAALTFSGFCIAQDILSFIIWMRIF